MKRVVTLFAIIITAGSLLALNLEHTVSVYNAMVSDYESQRFENPFVQKVSREVKNLTLYRYYKMLIAGSVDRRESTPSIGDYVSALYEVASIQNEDERLASALFLAYIVSKLSDQSVTKSSIMKNRAFSEFFGDYRAVITREAREFFKWLLSYSLNLTDVKPPVEISRVNEQLPQVDYTFQAPKDLSHLEDLIYFFNTPEIKTAFSESIERLSENIRKDPSRTSAHINREASFVSRDISKPITKFQDQIASEIEKQQTASKFPWWIRYVIYAALMAVFFRKKKLLWVLISVSGCFEIFYIFLVYDFTSPVDSMIYGIAIIFGFIFSIFVSLRRYIKAKNSLNLITFLAGIAIVIMCFVPYVFEASELSMSNFEEFPKSLYYAHLKRDIFESDLSRISTFTRELSSIMYQSLDHTQRTITALVDSVSEIVEEGVVDELEITGDDIYLNFRSDTNFFSHNEFEKRLQSFSSLSKDLDWYAIEERDRERDFKNIANSFLRYLSRAVAYSSSTFRDDILSYIETTFQQTYPVLNTFLPDVQNVFSRNQEISAKGPNISALEERTSIAVLLSLMLAFVIFVFMPAHAEIAPSALVAVFSVLFWIKHDTLSVFVEYGLPSLNISFSGTLNPGIFILSIGIFALSMFKLFRKGEKV